MIFRKAYGPANVATVVERYSRFTVLFRNNDRRVRRWLSCDTMLLDVPPQALDSLARRMNATPRKCLGYRTPAEVFREKLKDF